MGNISHAVVLPRTNEAGFRQQDCTGGPVLSRLLRTPSPSEKISVNRWFAGEFGMPQANPRFIGVCAGLLPDSDLCHRRSDWLHPQIPRFLYASRVIGCNPLEKRLGRPQIATHQPVVLDEESVILLVKAPGTSDPIGVRDRAMLELLYSTCIRRAEPASLRLKDLCMNCHTLLMERGKSCKPRMVPIGPHTRLWLRRYLAAVRTLLAGEEPISDSLFLMDYGDSFNAGSLGHLVRRYLNVISMLAEGGCHLLRHACAKSTPAATHTASSVQTTTCTAASPAGKLWGRFYFPCTKRPANRFVRHESGCKSYPPSPTRGGGVMARTAPRPTGRRSPSRKRSENADSIP